MTTLLTITGDVSDAIGLDFNPQQTWINVRYNTDVVVTDDDIRLGSGHVRPADDGTYELPNVVGETDLVENLQATIVVDFADRVARSHREITFGPYDLSGLSGTVDLRDLETVQHLDPTFLSAALAEIQGYVDQARDISEIEVPDDVMASVDADDGSAFRTQQDARVAQTITQTAMVPSDVATGPGIDPTGATSSTAALQAKIDGLPAGGMLFIPNGTYKLTAALTIGQTCSLVGESSQGNWPGLGAGGSFDLPLGNPPLRGVVLNQTAAGADGISITVSGNAVHLENLGILFTGVAVRWVNTGHGVNAEPTANVTNGHGTAKDHGVIDARWKNVNIFGHDGDHYGFRMVNTMLSTLENIRSWGGGGLEVLCDSVSGNYGNLVVIHPYANLFCEGTAHGYHFEGTAATGGYGLLNLITMIRPQCNGEDLTAIFPTSTAPTTAQYLILAGADYAIDRLSIIGPDFESPLHMPLSLGESRGHHIDVAGVPELAGVPTLTKLSPLAASTAALKAGSNDNAGVVQVVVGGADVNPYQNLWSIDFEHRDSGNYELVIQLGEESGYASLAPLYIPTKTSTGFTVASMYKLTASQNHTWTYRVTTGHVIND